MRRGHRHADPGHKAYVVNACWLYNIVNGATWSELKNRGVSTGDELVEDGDRSCVRVSDAANGLSVKSLYIPVTPTITIGCAANIEKTKAPRTDARRVSLTPYSVPILWNMSKEKARAGKMLDLCVSN